MRLRIAIVLTSGSCAGTLSCQNHIAITDCERRKMHIVYGTVEWPSLDRGSGIESTCRT
jgi:hypothetical protein